MRTKVNIMLIILIAISTVLFIYSCRKDVLVTNPSPQSSTPSTQNYIVNGSFENGLQGWIVENVYFQCDSPYIYTRMYNKVVPGGGNNICVLVNGTSQGYCWAYFPQLSQKVSGYSGHKLHIVFWLQQSCLKLNGSNISHQILDSAEMVAINYTNCINASTFDTFKVCISKNNNIMYINSYIIPYYIWKKYDTIINFSYTNADTIKLTFIPPRYTWPIKCFLLDRIELINR